MSGEWVGNGAANSACHCAVQSGRADSACHCAVLTSKLLQAGHTDQLQNLRNEASEGTEKTYVAAVTASWMREAGMTIKHQNGAIRFVSRKSHTFPTTIIKLARHRFRSRTPQYTRKTFSKKFQQVG